MAESMLDKKSQVEVSGNKDKSAVMHSGIGGTQQGSCSSNAPRKETGKKTDKLPIKSSGSGAGKKVSTPTTCEKDINKEVVKILQELNTNVNKQGVQLKLLSDRVDSLYEDYDENDENNDFYDYDYGNSSNTNEPDENVPDPSDVNDENTEPPAKKQKTLFEGLSDKFLLAEKVDDEINGDLAHFVNNSFRNGVPEERLQEIVKDINRPDNCDSLTVTRVNPGMWRLLKPLTQTEDTKMQTIQKFVIKSSVNISKMLDKEGESLSQESVEWGTNALALLGQSNKLINNRRKESHRYDFDPRYFPLTSPSLPYTDFLYGNETDINRNVKDIQDMSRIGKVGRPFRGRGYRGAPYRRGMRYWRRGFRGRNNRYNAENMRGAPYSKNPREGQRM